MSGALLTASKTSYKPGTKSANEGGGGVWPIYGGGGGGCGFRYGVLWMESLYRVLGKHHQTSDCTAAASSDS